MSGGAIVGIVFACLFGGALLGLFLGFILPDPHRSSETKDVMRLGMGLLATMTALVLSLLIASTKSSYDTKRSELDADGREYRCARPGLGALRPGGQ